MSYAIHTSSNFVDCCCSFVHLLITQWVVLKVNRITGNFRLISNYISLWWILYIILSLYCQVDKTRLRGLQVYEPQRERTGHAHIRTNLATHPIQVTGDGRKHDACSSS